MLFQFHARGLVLQFVPLALVVFLDEVPVADPAQFGAELEIVGQHFAVLPEEAIAVGRFGRDGRAVLAEVVGALVLDAPEIDQAGHVAGDAEHVFAVVGERAAVAEAALAQVVEADVEIGALRLVADAQQFDSRSSCVSTCVPKTLSCFSCARRM